MEYQNLFFDSEVLYFIVDKANGYGPTKDAPYIKRDNTGTGKFMALMISKKYVHIRLPVC